MRYAKYYAVFAKNELREKSKDLAEEPRARLTLARFFSKPQGGVTSLTDHDHLAMVKATFLCLMNKNAERFSEIRAIVGPAPLNLNTFDSWWLVEQSSSIFGWEEFMKEFTDVEWAQVAPTGIPNVDDCLSKYRTMKGI